MKELEKRMHSSESNADADGLPVLVARLGDDLVTLLEGKLTLLTIEVKEEMAAYARTSLTAGVAAAAALVGFTFVNVALAFLAAGFLDAMHYSLTIQYALGFLLVGLPYLAVGGLLLRRFAHRLMSTTNGR